MADEGRIEKALKRVRSARADYEAKQDDVHQARECYYDAVRSLNASGMTLREVADALGLSHQRVHQMVTESSDTRSKLRKTAGKAAKAGGAVTLVVFLGVAALLFRGSLRATNAPGATPDRVASAISSASPDDVERRPRRHVSGGNVPCATKLTDAALGAKMSLTVTIRRAASMTIEDRPGLMRCWALHTFVRMRDSRQ